MYNVRVMLNSKVKNNLIICLVVAVAGILDFATATLFQTVLHVPLFLDMTFAMAVLFAYGVLPAIMTYVVNVICGCIKLVILYGKNDYVYLFTLSALIIILVTWAFVRKKENLKKGVNLTFLYILSAAVCAGLACSVVSGIISYFTYTLVMEAGPFDKIIFAFSGEQMGVLASCIVGRIPVTILDRIITTFGGFGLYLIYTRIMYRGGAGAARLIWNENSYTVAKPEIAMVEPETPMVEPVENNFLHHHPSSLNFLLTKTAGKVYRL